MEKQALHQLNKGLTQLGLREYEPGILRYIELLKKWNRAFNLVADASDHILVTHHVLDSLTAFRFVDKGPCLDVGTGAGLPGLLLAVTMPDVEWHLLDSNGKKTQFCEQAVFELALPNVTVLHKRVENHQPDECYNVIISRAVTQAAVLIELTRRLKCPDGIILAMKGREDEAEKLTAQATGFDIEIVQTEVPGLAVHRHMMIFR